jgi:hypothetical protein
MAQQGNLHLISKLTAEIERECIAMWTRLALDVLVQ